MKTYEDGLNDAWKAARKILCESGYNFEKLEDIFGFHTLDGILNIFTASEAIAKIEEYENRIEVGDEVECNKEKGVVLEFDEDSTTIMKPSGKAVIVCNKEIITKTGRHFSQIEEVLERMKEDE